MIITLSGVDGSGKTTNALFVKKKLEENKRKVVYIHMIRWTLVYRLGELIQKFNQDEKPGKRDKFPGKKYRPLMLFVSLIDVFRFYLLNFLIGIVGRYDIICDRYFYDLGVQAVYTERMGKRFELFYWRIVPKPKISMLFDLNPEKAIIREGEHSLLYYEKKRKLYLDRCDMWGVHVIQEESIDNVQNIIINILSAELGARID